MDNLHPTIAPLSNGNPSSESPAEPPRDLLDDIGIVLGVATWSVDKVPAADIPARLRSLAPDWVPYRTINGLHIRQYLETEHGVKVPTTGRRYPVDPVAIREAIARRDGHAPAGEAQRW